MRSCNRYDAAVIFHIIAASLFFSGVTIGAMMIGFSKGWPDGANCFSNAMCIAGYTIMLFVSLVLINWIIFGIYFCNNLPPTQWTQYQLRKYAIHSCFINGLLVVLCIGASLIGTATPKTFANGNVIGGFVCFLLFIAGSISYIIVSCRLHRK